MRAQRLVQRGMHAAGEDGIAASGQAEPFLERAQRHEDGARRFQVGTQTERHRRHRRRSAPWRPSAANRRGRIVVAPSQQRLARNGAGFLQTQRHRISRRYLQPLAQHAVENHALSVDPGCSSSRRRTRNRSRRRGSVTPRICRRIAPSFPLACTTIVPCSRITGQTRSAAPLSARSPANACRKKRGAISASSTQPSCCSVRSRRLPRSESPTSRAPVSTAVPTTTPRKTARLPRQ